MTTTSSFFSISCTIPLYGFFLYQPLCFTVHTASSLSHISLYNRLQKSNVRYQFCSHMCINFFRYFLCGYHMYEKARGSRWMTIKKCTKFISSSSSSSYYYYYYYSPPPHTLQSVINLEIQAQSPSFPISGHYIKIFSVHYLQDALVEMTLTDFWCIDYIREKRQHYQEWRCDRSDTQYNMMAYKGQIYCVCSVPYE